MRFTRTRRPRSLALAASALLVASPLHAQCGSASRYAGTVWEKYIDEAREAGCLSPLKGKAKTAACFISTPAITVKIFDRMVGWWNSAADGEWVTIGPRRLDPEWQFGTLWGTSGRLFLATAPVQSTTMVEVMKRDGRAPAEVVICATAEDGTTRELTRRRFERGTDNVNETARFLFTDLAAEVVSVKVDAKDWVPTNKFEYRIRLSTEPIENDLGPVPGFADLHLHQAAELGFGGDNLWGSHIGPKATALPANGHANTLAQALIDGPVEWALGLHSLPGAVIGEGDSRHGGGYPDFDRWPHFNDVTHQQVHEDWLKQAHEGGLNLVVVSAVNFEGYCYLLKALFPRPGDRMRCRDMENVERQLQAFIDMAEQRDWYEIAVHPWHARQIIHDGKLAVVLSMEVSHLLPQDEGDFVTQLDRLWGRGLRSLQLAHETDSRYAGAAPHRWPFGIFNSLKWGIPANTEPGLGFDLDEDGKNRMGLTGAGIRLIEAMIDRNMLIDVAHLSEQAVYDVYQLVANRHDYYPLYDSHTRFESLLLESDRKVQGEFLTTDEQVRYIRRTGGMVGLRTGQNAILTVTGPDGTGVPNDCDGSSKSFAQLVHYGRNARLAMGIGSDLNGFINQLGPRFGNEACPRAGIQTPLVDENGDFLRDDRGVPLVADLSAAAAAEAKRQRGVQADSTRAPCTIGGADEGRDFHHDGLRHVGYLPDLMADLEALGTPGIEILESSAEAFLRMWERTWDESRGPVPDDVDRAAEIAGSVNWSPCDLHLVRQGALEALAGSWIRVDSNNDPNDGMRIHFDGRQATLVAMPPSGHRSFQVGQVLWQDIEPDLNLKVRGSDGGYYPSLITMDGPDRLHIDVDRANSPGNDQTWERAGPTIDGVWVLSTASDGADVGLQIQVRGDEAEVRYIPAGSTSDIRVGNALWRTIRGGGVMEARAGGRTYHAARVEVRDEDRLSVEIQVPGAMVRQGWVRRGSPAERAGEIANVPRPVGPTGPALPPNRPDVDLPEISLLDLLEQARDSVASPAWGTVALDAEDHRFMVLACEIGSSPDDAIFLRGAGRTEDGRSVEVTLERTDEPGGIAESAAVVLGDAPDDETWTALRRSRGGQWISVPGGAAEGPLFNVDNGMLRVDAEFIGRPGSASMDRAGAPARRGTVEVQCPAS